MDRERFCDKQPAFNEINKAQFEAVFNAGVITEKRKRNLKDALTINKTYSIEVQTVHSLVGRQLPRISLVLRLVLSDVNLSVPQPDRVQVGR